AQHDRAVACVGEPHGRGVGVSVGHRSISRRRPPAPLRKRVSQWSGQSAPSSPSRQVPRSVRWARWETGSMESLAPSVPVLHQSYADALPELSAPWRADAPPRPEIVWLNEPLARELGFAPQWLRGEEGLALLTGQIDGTTAQAYAGHQFGSPNPQLGDGRAVLLGDLLDTDGRRRDLHLKGAGRTPFARGGDGKAPLGPMLREAVFGEWLHAVGAPTTRALAVLSTGEQIVPRQGVTPEPGALLVRVAASHLRVGTFEYATWHLDEEVRERLLEHTLQRHHPSADGPLGLLEAVTADQAELVARWTVRLRQPARHRPVEPLPLRRDPPAADRRGGPEPRGGARHRRAGAVRAPVSGGLGAGHGAQAGDRGERGRGDRPRSRAVRDARGAADRPHRLLPRTRGGQGRGAAGGCSLRGAVDAAPGGAGCGGAGGDGGDQPAVRPPQRPPRRGAAGGAPGGPGPRAGPAGGGDLAVHAARR